MFRNRRGTFLLAGLAAFAYYKYSKLSDDQKRNLAGTIKEKGQKFYDQYISQSLKDIFGRTKEEPYFSEHSDY